MVRRHHPIPDINENIGVKPQTRAEPCGPRFQRSACNSTKFRFGTNRDLMGFKLPPHQVIIKLPVIFPQIYSIRAVLRCTSNDSFIQR